VAEEFVEQGFSNVSVIKGGVEAWKDSGFPMAESESFEHRSERIPSLMNKFIGGDCHRTACVGIY